VASAFQERDVLDLVASCPMRLAGAALPSCLRPADDPDMAVLDLSRVTWVEPIGLVGLATFAEAQVAMGRRVRLIGPTDPSISSYLSRMRLGTAIDMLGGQHDLVRVREHDVGEALLELRRFDGEEGADELAAHVYNKVASMPTVAHALHMALTEIGGNVPQHSLRKRGWIAAQESRRLPRFQFAVGDSGCGIRASLAAAVAVESDAEALRTVLQSAVSSTREPGRGQGILETRRLITRLDGHVQLLSGTGLAHASAHDVTTRTWQRAVPGTLLQGTVQRPAKNAP
jgi:hypothetical protein